MLGSDSAQRSSRWRPLLTLADSHYGCQKTRASKEPQPRKGVEAQSKPSNLLPHPTCGPKHNTICPTCSTQTASLDCASFASCLRFGFPRYIKSLWSDLCRRAVPASTQSGAPRHTHTRRRRATSCHGGRTRRTRSPTPLAACRLCAGGEVYSFQSIAHSRGRRPLQLSALHVVINNSKVHTQSQE